MGAATALQEPTAKQKLWFRHYTDESNKTTFLNGVQSALLSYNTTDYETANQIAVDTKKALAPHITKWLDEVALSEDALKTKVKSLMNAGETKFVKVKGAVMQEDLLPGQRIVCTSGVVKEEKNDDGEVTEVFGAGDTLIAIDMDAKETQRRSTDMAIKIRGMYAADKLEIFGLEGLAGRLDRANKRTDPDASPKEVEDDDLFS